MSDSTSLQDIVVDEALEAVDVETLINGGSLREEIDGREVGAAVGRRVGEQVGRRTGTRIGAAIQEGLSRSREEGHSLEELLAELVRSVRTAVANILEEIGQQGLAERIAPGSATSEEQEDDESAEDIEADAESESDDGNGHVDDDSVTDDESETDDDEGDTTDRDTDSDSETEIDIEELAEGEEPPDTADLAALRREAIDAVLEQCSYRDLQSIAKSVGVKANLEAGEMRDRIATTVVDTDQSSTNDGQGEVEPEAEAD